MGASTAWVGRSLWLWPSLLGGDGEGGWLTRTEFLCDGLPERVVQMRLFWAVGCLSSILCWAVALSTLSMIPMCGDLTLTQFKAQVRHQLVCGCSGEMDTIWIYETLIKVLSCSLNEGPWSTYSTWKSSQRPWRPALNVSRRSFSSVDFLRGHTLETVTEVAINLAPSIRSLYCAIVSEMGVSCRPSQSFPPTTRTARQSLFPAGNWSTLAWMSLMWPQGCRCISSPPAYFCRRRAWCCCPALLCHGPWGTDPTAHHWSWRRHRRRAGVAGHFRWWVSHSSLISLAITSPFAAAAAWSHLCYLQGIAQAQWGHPLRTQDLALVRAFGDTWSRATLLTHIPL